MTSDCRTAVDKALGLAQVGDWHAAHALVQDHEEDPMADWLHAILHRIEGDRANASWWYGKIGRSWPEISTPQELGEVRAALDALSRDA